MEGFGYRNKKDDVGHVMILGSVLLLLLMTVMVLGYKMALLMIQDKEEKNYRYVSSVLLEQAEVFVRKESHLVRTCAAWIEGMEMEPEDMDSVILSMIKAIYAEYRESYYLYDLYFAGEDNNTLSGLCDGITMEYVKDRQWYLGAVQAKNQFYYSSPYADDREGEKVITISRAVYGSNGLLGVVALDMYAEALEEFVEAQEISENSYMMLFDKRNQLILHPQNNRKNFEFYQELIQKRDWDESADKPMVITDYDGRERTLYAEPMLNGAFYGVVAVSNGDKNYNSRVLIGYFIGATILCLLIGCAILYFFMRTVERIQTACSARSQFLTSLTHEIRTPMNAINGLTELIVRDGIEGKKQKYVYQLREASGQLLAMINDILDFSRIEAGKFSIVEADYCLSDVLYEITVLIRELSEEKGLAFSLYTAPNLPEYLYGDSMRIRQVLLNLANNAVKYTQQGSVQIAAEYRTYDGVVELVFSVTDTGIGIRREDAARLFENYERADRVRNHDVEGSGLGLAISKQLADMMHGTISFQSEYNKGSCFTFTVPQKYSIRGAKKRGRDWESLSWEGRTGSWEAPQARLLLVDDNQINLNVAEGLMEPYHMQISKARSGRQALRMILNGTYDLVLMDYRMPGMDGRETIQRIRTMQGEYYESLPVIAMTANTADGSREKLLKYGMSDFLEKPLDMEKLDFILRRWLPEEKIREKQSRGCPVPGVGESQRKRQAALAQGNAQILAKTQTLAEAQLDLSMALQYTGTARTLTAVFEECLEEADEKMERIRFLEQQEEWQEYTVEVHGLKGTARMIGAVKLAAMAETLEQAGNNQDAQVLHQETGRFLEYYKRIQTVIQAFVPKAPEQAENADEGIESTGVENLQGSGKELKELLFALRREIEGFDLDGAEEVLKRLSAQNLGMELDQGLADVQKALTRFDYRQGLKILRRLIENYQ